ncbi:transposase zinc-binding domain-containing protein [Anaerocolumna aminovalerica]|uniref:transposase zinc-binding domain-containing protein n=1 Tax=Anaerocolumna aminovalerica TaxID=1527 RepID=UPI001FA89AA8
MLYILHPRKTVIDNVNRMLNFGDSSHGGAFWGCPDCGKLKFVSYTCKSRFCPSCGNMYNQKRSFHMSCKLISCVQDIVFLLFLKNFVASF